MIYLGADHGGFTMKETIKRKLARARIPFIDCGAQSYDRFDDYPLIARTVARAVAGHPRHRGILFCRSGVGVTVVANKVRGIRSVLAEDAWIARRARRDENANILALPAEHLTPAQLWTIITAWRTTRYRGAPRDRRRLRQIRTIERA